ncbi:MAG: hypothetical protein ABL934_02785 [Lysobacteraceae bacterium]
MNKTKRFFVALMLAALAYAGSAGAIPAPLNGYQTLHYYYSDSGTLVGVESWNCENVHWFSGTRNGRLVRFVERCENFPAD